MSRETLELLSEGGALAGKLRSPAVGTFTCPRAKGAVLVAGESAGFLRVLGRDVSLLVPPGVFGRVANDPPARVRAPVAYGDLLYELEAAGDVGDTEAAAEAPRAADDGGLVLRAPQAGRFYHRPGPDRPPYLVEGAELAPGVPVGLIEVMKTFTQIVYRSGDGLPERARFVRWTTDDGAEVTAGDALLALESA